MENNCENSSNKVLDKISKIYVINLERSKDRWEKAKKSLDKLDIKYERFNAINGMEVKIKDKDSDTEFHGIDFKNNITSLEIGHKYEINCNPGNETETKFNYLHINLDYKYSMGYFGIICSNLMIAKEIVSNKYQYTIVFEDDISVNPKNFKEKLASYINHLPATFDLAYLGVYNNVSEQVPVNQYVNKFADGANFFCRMGLIESYKAAEKFILNPMFWGSLDHFIRANAVYNNIANTEQKILEVYLSPQLQGDIWITSDYSEIEKMKV